MDDNLLTTLRPKNTAGTAPDSTPPAAPGQEVAGSDDALAAAAPPVLSAPPLLKLDEVAAVLRCTRRSLERQIADRRISVLHIGRSVRIEPAELDAYLERLRHAEDHHHRTTTGTTTSAERRGQTA